MASRYDALLDKLRIKDVAGGTSGTITTDTETTVTGLLKGSGGFVAAATSNTDYAAATHASRHAVTGADPVTAANVGAPYLHGFANGDTDTTLSFDNSTHVLTLAPTGANFVYYYKGTPVTCTAKTVDLDTYTLAAGLWYVYFAAADGALVASQTPWAVDYATVPVCTVFWNGSAGTVIEEQHSAYRNVPLHAMLHSAVGSRYESGGVLTTPSTGTPATIDISAGYLWDEDIRHAQARAQNCRLWYQTGVSTYTWADATTAYLWNGGTSRIRYINGSYAATDLTNSQYTNVWAYWVPDTSRGLYCFVETVSSPHTTVALARAVNPPDLSGKGLTSELKLMFRFIFRGDGAFQESTDYRTSSSVPSGGTGSTTALSTIFTPSGTIAATNVQAAVEEVVSDLATSVTTAQVNTDHIFEKTTSHGVVVDTTLKVNAIEAATGSVVTVGGLQIDTATLDMPIFKNWSEIVSALGNVSGITSPSTSSATIFTATATGNVTWQWTINYSGQSFMLWLTNGGAYTQSWPSGTKFPGGTAPTLTASGTDIIAVSKVGSTTYLAAVQLDVK